MKHALAIQVVWFLLVLAGCSGSAGPLAGYEQGKGDLGGFIVKAAPKLGVHLLQTISLPSIPGRWHYQARPDELAIVVEGDCFPQLHSFLTNTVGLAQGSSTTDKTTGVLEAYYGTNLTATVCCRSGITDAGKKYTSLVIVGYGSTAPKQAGYAHLVSEAVQKEYDSHSALDAARPSAPYVSDFVRLFPAAEVRYRSFSGGLGFDVTVDLFERYEFTMQLPVVFDSSRSKVIDFGEPRFTLWEAASVKRNRSGIAETTLNPAGERRFGSTEWRRIVEAGGDFSAIGYAMVTNRPVPDFSGRREIQTVNWEQAVALIRGGTITSVGQTHSLYVWMQSKDGRQYKTREPRIDDVKHLIDEVDPTHRSIRFGTE